MSNLHQKNDFSWPLVGNQPVKDFLNKTLLVDNPAPVYVFVGPDGIGKTAAARYFAFNLLVKYAPELADLDSERLELSGDVAILECLPEKQLIGIEQVRDLIWRLGLGSFSNSYKIGIIKAADRLSEGAANALLKILEEPQVRTIIILTASSQEGLLPTIISRAQVIEFQTTSKEDIYRYLNKNKGLSPELANKCSSLALGRPALALKLAENSAYLEEYELLADKVYELFSDVSENRFAASEALAKHLEGRLMIFNLEDVLIIAQSWLRDCLLAQWEAPQWWRHEAWREQLERLARRPDFNQAAIVRRLQALAKAQSYARTHFSAKVILEYLAINF